MIWPEYSTSLVFCSLPHSPFFYLTRPFTPLSLPFLPHSTLFTSLSLWYLTQPFFTSLSPFYLPQPFTSLSLFLLFFTLLSFSPLTSLFLPHSAFFTSLSPFYLTQPFLPESAFFTSRNPFYLTQSAFFTLLTGFVIFLPMPGGSPSPEHLEQPVVRGAEHPRPVVTPAHASYSRGVVSIIDGLQEQATNSRVVEKESVEKHANRCLHLPACVWFVSRYFCANGYIRPTLRPSHRTNFAPWIVVGNNNLFVRKTNQTNNRQTQRQTYKKTRNK